jgi:polyisoprenoid-binding protein YceI
MKKLLLTTAFAVALPLAAFAEATPAAKEMPAGVYVLDKNHGSVTWKVSHMGMSNYTARFKRIDAKVDYNPKDISKSVVTATIDPTSIETDYPDAAKKDFNKELSEGKDWFNAGQFPQITFKSTGIKRLSGNKGTMTGDVTFLGVTKPVSFDVTFNAALPEHPFTKQPAMGFSAVGHIKRSEFGMTQYIPMIGDDVEVLVEVEFAKAAQ